MSQLTAGQLLILPQDKEILPIHTTSSHYQSNAVVIPDGETFVPVLVRERAYAMHKNDDAAVMLSALDETGQKVYVHRYEYNYLRAISSHDRYVYFVSERAAEVANYKYSIRKGVWMDKSNEDFFGCEFQLSYHTSQQSGGDKLKHMKQYVTDSDEWLIGFEVEKTDESLRRQGLAWELFQETGWCKESDGSLGSGGYELVSPILPLFNTDVVNAAINPVRSWIDGRCDASCGGHITISNRKKTAKDLLEEMKAIIPVLYAIYPNRIDNRYCRAKKFNDYLFNIDKYSAFFLKDGRDKVGGRIEIRIPSRVVNTNTLLWRHELIQLLITEVINGSNLNQVAMKIGSPENKLHKFFLKQYCKDTIGEKLRLIHRYSQSYGTHKSGLSKSVRERINKTMDTVVFTNI